MQANRPVETTARAARLLLSLLALVLLPLADSHAATFTVNTAIGVGDATYDGQDIVVSNCTLTVNGPHGFASLSVIGNGVVTHAAAPNGETDNRLDLAISGDITVDATSAISADGRGHGPASGPGGGGSSGGNYGSGAGHGGVGGWGTGGNAPGGTYGSLTAPTAFGSGGGNSYYGSGAGAGGGAVQLDVGGEFHLDGRVSANGTSSSSDRYCGGGSGGSVCVTVGILTGTGVISTRGGDGGSPVGGGGAGGRIAVRWGTNSFAGLWSAGGGGGNQRGGAGTVYLKQALSPTATVWIDNGGNGGGLTRLNPNQWPAGEAFALVVNGGAVVWPDAPLTLAALTVSANSWLGHGPLEETFHFTVLGDVFIDATSGVNVTGMGYGPTAGPGAGGSSGGNYGSGAGHGGVGGWGVGGNTPGGTYGSLTAPTAFGSGGGNSYYRNGGGSGGGAVRLDVAGELRLEGHVIANGTDSTSYSGGGSGGSVYLTVGILTGAGTISATGGSGLRGDPVGGGGGGGRVAIYHHGTSGSVSSSIAVGGGPGYDWGHPGTVHLSTTLLPFAVTSSTPSGTLRQPVGSVDVAFNLPALSATFTVADVLVTTPSGQIPSGDITVTALSSATFRIGFPAQTAAGAYEIQIGPQVENLYGDPMAATYTGGFMIDHPVVFGYVRRAGGLPLANVPLDFGGGRSTATSSDGSYALAVPPGWSGTVTPTKPGWAFAPASRAYALVTADTTDQDFAAALAVDPVISGTVQGGILQFGWPSAEGQRYQLQSATNLPSTNWHNEGTPFTGTGSGVSTNFPVGSTPTQFFRLQLLDN